jgi:hypothetical protein
MAIPMVFYLKCACCGIEQRDIGYGYCIHYSQISGVAWCDRCMWHGPEANHQMHFEGERL